MMHPMERADILVIGAGVVGLACAERLSASGREVILIERHDGFGRETSSRNSEVIHSGLYYPENLLKTTLCLEGNPRLYELCGKKGIPFRKIGKVVVATTAQECESIHRVFKQAALNGVPGVKMLDESGIKDLEPQVSGRIGLCSPESGILDVHQLMKYLEQVSLSQGVTIAYNCEVIDLEKTNGYYTAAIRDADGQPLELEASVVINSAGLFADRIAAMAGIDIDAEGYRIHPCKGEYFSISRRHKGVLKHLVYPAPTPMDLGTHATPGLDGGLKLGPSAFSVDALNYDVDPAHAQLFFDEARKFLPFLEYDDLSPDMSGIRPKLYREGEAFRDFIIREESDRGLPGLINLVGIESPGLTACLTIARMAEGFL